MLRRLFALAGSLLLAALCSTSQAATATPDTSTASSERAEGKVLVAYFSSLSYQQCTALLSRRHGL